MKISLHAKLFWLSFLFFLSMNATKVQADEIVVSWIELQQEVRPQKWTGTVSKHVELTLQGGNLIDDKTSAEVNGKNLTFKREGRFRDSMTTGQGKSTASWRVESDKTLVRTADFQSHILTIRVGMTSDTTCRADVSYKLKPGIHEYRMKGIMTGEPLYFNSVSVKSVDCKANP